MLIGWVYLPVLASCRRWKNKALLGKINLHITVRGRVQGVGFRAFVYRAATELDLKGYVKNQVDNTVFVEIEGEESLTNSFVAKCKVGPGWSHVEQVEMEEYPIRGFVDFKIKY